MSLIDQIDREWVQPLPPEQQLELVAAITRRLTVVLKEAQATGQDLRQMGEEVEATDDVEAGDGTVEREKAAYIALHPMLLEKYPGEHVAIYGGQLID
jgi:hypothetical protein